MDAELPVAGVGAPGLEALAGRQVALIDLLDRLLTGGAVLTGDLVLSIADVDLVHINVRAVIRSITAENLAPW
ncbi:gas vesicle protein [Streptomyces zagrosensis]|uniref:Gas vesicle protein n=1 Tax=Streptomyces zagrosensis TaxID=1042984 RepID=A0A7W9QBE1_9ACTN|nr:gas vesicle protein [Streptomyces zagrosensis]MBB5937070.1 hypothetical protein [Streptomyces zagrosensis]